MMEKKLKQLNNGIEKAYPVLFGILMALIVFLCFYKLDAKYVDTWDEARHGVNAYEMLKEGNLIKSTYLYETDYYNLKPPLSMWAIMLSFSIFGTTVFALRLPSAIAYIVLTLVAGLFAKRYGKPESLFVLGFLAANTTPFLHHMIRAGDADSLYVLFFTLAMLFMMKISEKQRNLYWCGLFFSLALLTKSFHAAAIAVIGGLFLIFTGEIKKMSLKVWGIFAAVTVSPVVLWIIARVFVDGKAFFREMWNVDVMGRSVRGAESAEVTGTYYLEYFLGAMSGKLTVYLAAFVICIAGSLIFSYVFKKENYKKIIGYALWILIPFLAFCKVSNLLWYMYPVLIGLLMLAGIVTGRILKWDKLIAGGKLVFGLAVILMLGYFTKDIITTIQYDNRQQGNAFQDFLVETVEENQMPTAYSYISLNEGENEWAQQDVFLAEAYGDLLCKPGGIEAARKAEPGADENVAEEGIADEVLIFTGREYYESKPELFEGFEVLNETTEYVALRRM